MRSHCESVSRLLALLLVAATSLLPLSVNAATASSTPKESATLVPPGSLSNDLPSCFDYYQFGSINSFLTADLQSVRVGVPIAVRANVENRNNYPVVDASLYVRVFHQLDSTEKNVQGPDVVDYFPVAGGFTLKAHESKQITFIWHVPGDTEPGQYRMVPFVVQADRFNFLGLTFTDDITGPPFEFSIVGDTKGSVRFDRTTASLDGAPYHFAAYSPTVSDHEKDVPITVHITNTTTAAYGGTVTWRLYYWDGTRDGALLQTTTNPVTVPAGSTKQVHYTVSDTAHSVYYLRADLSTRGGTKSIAAFRFVRAGVNQPRLSALEAASYPLAKGSVGFACFHSSGTDKSEHVQVKVSITSLPLLGFISIPYASKTYTGIAPGNLVALTVPAHQTYRSFQLVATISQKGHVLDRVAIPYDCSVFGACTLADSPFVPVLFLVGVILLIVGGFQLLQHRSRTRHHRWHATKV